MSGVTDPNSFIVTDLKKNPTKSTLICADRLLAGLLGKPPARPEPAPASERELEGLAPELRAVAVKLALAPDAVAALKKHLSGNHQGRAAQRLADPGVMFGISDPNAFILADLQKKKKRVLLRDDVGDAAVDADLVAAVDGLRLSEACYDMLRNLSKAQQARYASALRSVDFSTVGDPSACILRSQVLSEASPPATPGERRPRAEPADCKTRRLRTMFLGGLRWGEGTGPASDAELEGDIRSLLGRAGHGAGLVGLYVQRALQLAYVEFDDGATMRAALEACEGSKLRGCDVRWDVAKAIPSFMLAEPAPAVTPGGDDDAPASKRQLKREKLKSERRRAGRAAATRWAARSNKITVNKSGRPSVVKSVAKAERPPVDGPAAAPGDGAAPGERERRLSDETDALARRRLEAGRADAGAELADEVLELVDESPSGTILCANLPQHYKEKFGKLLDLKARGGAKTVLSRLPGVRFEGTFDASVSSEHAPRARAAAASAPAPAPASDAKLRALAADVLALCDAAPSGALLCGDLPRLYGRAFGRRSTWRHEDVRFDVAAPRRPARADAGRHRGEPPVPPGRRRGQPHGRGRAATEGVALGAELKRRVAAFASAEGLDDGCRAALERYAVADADRPRTWRVKNLTGFVLMGLKKGTLLRKGQKREAVRRSNGAPEEFLCPLTLELMRDPVIAAAQRMRAIAPGSRKSTSPVTNERIEWTPSAATAAAVPPAHPWERVPGGDVNRIFGVVESFQADSGYLRRGIPRRTRDYDVHFRSRDAPQFESLQVGTEVEFTLVDYYGTASATDVAAAAAARSGPRGRHGLWRAARRPAAFAAEPKAPPPCRFWKQGSCDKGLACPFSHGARAGAELALGLDGLATEVLRLVDAAPSGTVLCANLPRLYYLKYRKALDLKAYGASKMSALVSKLPGVHFGGTHRAEVSRRGTGLGVGDAIDASALAIREETQARVRAHRAERDAAASGALRYFDPRAAEDAARWAAGCREVVVLMPVRGADRPPGLPHDSVALLKQPGAWPGSFLLRCDPEAYRRDRRGVLDELTRVVGAAALRVESWGSPAIRRRDRRRQASIPRRPRRPGGRGSGRSGSGTMRRQRRLDAEDRSSQPPRRRARARAQAAGGAPTSGNAAPASAPLPRAAPRETTSAFDGPVAWDELQRRVKAFADALKLDGRCRKTLEAYAVRDADACVRFLRAAPGDLGDHVNESVPLKDRSKYVSQAILHNHLLAASASELNALAPELRSVADALALTSNVAKALKKLSLAQQRRAAERLADPGVMFGVLLRNAFVLAELKKKERGCLLRDDLGNGRVDEDLVAALDGFRLSKDCYRSLRDRSRKKQALCALALESMDLSKITDLSGYIEKGLNKGTLLRKGQELMGTSTPAMASLVSAAAARAGIRREALPAPRDEDNVPEEFLCPISMEIMTDPVIAADGHTYERRAIEAWFGRAHTSPTTNAPLPHLNLIPAHTIKSLIQRHLEQ
ncbi:ubiquitin-protein transferase [Aureococcus anophagefferens]|nr:ubiquitin-protein transferase [Aureococcus anophagefferens]